MRNRGHIVPIGRQVTPNGGQVYIGLIISIGLFVILSQSIFSLVISVFDLVSFTRARTTATHLANEKMETYKNLSYGDLGVVGGIPNGVIVASENTIRGGLNYTVETTVVFIDDSFDDLAPTDLDPTDYKRLQVVVVWGGLGAPRVAPVILSTNISPPDNSSGAGGVLSITVIDSLSMPVPQADVAIIASSVVPPVNVTLQTDSSGLVILPGALPCGNCYEITVSKTDYSTDRTYSDSEVTNPTKPHVTAIDGEISTVSFAIDLTGTLDITSTNDRDANFSVFPNQSFRLRGEKLIGTDAFGIPVYKYDQILITGGGGNLELIDMEWDNYHILIPDGGSWDISGVNPLPPDSLFPGASLDIAFASTASSLHRLLTVFTDSFDVPLASVSATITEGAFEAILETGEAGDPDHGQAFFDSLTETSYNLFATASGFLDFSGSVVVSDYTIERVILLPE